MSNEEYIMNEVIIRKWKPMIQTYVDMHMSDENILLLVSYGENNETPNNFMQLIDDYKEIYIVGDLKHNILLYYMIFEPNSIQARQHKIDKIING